ncbi:MAG: hypothetical protein RL385_31 [Pseudomonadota bacterium]
MHRSTPKDNAHAECITAYRTTPRNYRTLRQVRGVGRGHNHRRGESGAPMGNLPRDCGLGTPQLHGGKSVAPCAITRAKVPDRRRRRCGQHAAHSSCGQPCGLPTACADGDEPAPPRLAGAARNGSRERLGGALQTATSTKPTEPRAFRQVRTRREPSNSCSRGVHGIAWPKLAGLLAWPEEPADGCALLEHLLGDASCPHERWAYTD